MAARPRTNTAPTTEVFVAQSLSELIERLSDDQFTRNIMPDQSTHRGKRWFGLWFRGHSDESYALVPNLLRVSYQANEQVIEERQLIRHFRALNPDAAPGAASDFDWLVTMQHYLAATRLLDWTENLLVAVYFAVRDGLDKDGAIWLLNARRLNYYSSVMSKVSEICFPNDVDVIARSYLPRARYREDFLDIMRRELSERRYDQAEYRVERLLKALGQVKLLPVDIVGNASQSSPLVPAVRAKREQWYLPSNIDARLRMPIAVYPARANGRIRAQAGTFTLHGGKYVADPGKYTTQKPYPSALGLPISLTAIDSSLGSKKILKQIRIPKARKPAFRDTLERLGVTDATLFPELDYQSRYLRQQWTFDLSADEEEE